jgi:hypothetical protein
MVVVIMVIVVMVPMIIVVMIVMPPASGGAEKQDGGHPEQQNCLGHFYPIHGVSPQTMDFTATLVRTGESVTGSRRKSSA